VQARRGRTAVLGDVVTVTAPVVLFRTGEGRPDATRLVGYATISLSDKDEEAALNRVYMILLGVGCVVLLLTFPAVYLIVHRIFTPIRQFVDATNRIAGGNLEAKVAIERPDLIGTLARSFNEMVLCVKSQRQDLEDINNSLEEKVEQRTNQLEAANKRLSSEIAE